MTNLLTIPATPGAPVACDLTGAEDTIEQRLAEYRRLFEHAAVSRESTDDVTTFRFAGRPGVREWVQDLVRREADCCPFLSYEVDLEGEEIVWTTIRLGVSELAALPGLWPLSADVGLDARSTYADKEEAAR